ncbi:hypothetical protein [Nonomuraea polychroma]|uniref:hypothetical protein n=1 Tax=Nonomuraea polychroma TaxID=46176 RepID=UPI000FDF6481|nr:hypothetical protein [Nonomuraea polychroma]
MDINARVAPLAATINTAAASDPDIDGYWRGVTESRRAGMNQMIAGLATQGQLRPGLDPQRATDIMVVLYSHETFLGLTRDAGWSVPEYKAWLYETLSRQLLEATQHTAEATEDLSYHDLLRAH